MRKEFEYYLSAYSFFLSRRKTETEKADFLEKSRNIYTNLGYKTEVFTSEGGKDKTLVIGDLNKCHKIVAASYDIPLKTVLPGFRFYPMDYDRSKRYEIANFIYTVIIFALASFLPFMVYKKLGEIKTAVKILLLLLYVLLIYAVYRYCFGDIRNNDAQNNCLSFIYALADSEHNDDIAYVLADKSRINQFGLRKLIEEKKLYDKSFYILDSIYSDDSLYFINRNLNLSEKCSVIADDERKHNILSYISQGVIITDGYKKDENVYVVNHRNNKKLPVNFERLKEKFLLIEREIKRK